MPDKHLFSWHGVQLFQRDTEVFKKAWPQKCEAGLFFISRLAGRASWEATGFEPRTTGDGDCSTQWPAANFNAQPLRWAFSFPGQANE